MSISRVAGNLLQDNLQRGANLSIQGNLAYFDVVNDRVGINTNSPVQDLTVAGNLGVGNYIVVDAETISSTANIIFSTPSGNISVSNVYVQDVLDPLQAQDAATKNYVDTALSSLLTFEDDGANTTGIAAGDTVFFNGTANQIAVVVSSLAVNFSLTPDVIISGNFDAGNITTGGNITATGNIQGGNIISDGAVIGNVTIGGNLTVANLTVTDYFAGNYVSVSNTVSATGNIIGGNLISNADVTTVSVTASGNVTLLSAGANSVLYTDANNNVATTANLTFDGSQLILSGSANVDNINIDGTSITSNANLTITTTSGNLVFDVSGDGITQIVSTGSLTLPVGNTAQRPASPDQGTIRFNTNTLAVEVWDGTQWEPVGQDFVEITNQTLVGDGSTAIFTLDEETTEAAIIVATNGVMQFPGSAYTVAGNLITFAEAPQISDIIDVRFISSISTVNAITNLSGDAEITVTLPGVADITTCHSLQLPTYTVAQANALGNVAAGQIIYVSNGDTGNPCLAVYSGGAWKRVALGANIST